MTSRQRAGIFLAYNLRTYGNLPDAWLSPRLKRFSLYDPAYWAEFAQLAETGLLDAVFTGDAAQITDPTTAVADGLDRFTAWTAAIEATEHVGFMLTASTTYNDPFRLAERLLSLDVLSGGRLAWNVVTSHSGAAAANFGLPAHPPRETRYARGEEFVGLVTELWAGATVEYESEHFVVHGRLAVPPSRQGRPPIVRASTSDAGRSLAGRYANGVFAADLTRAGAVEHRTVFRDDARRFGRPAEHLNYLSGLRLVLGSTQAEAEAKVSDIYGQSSDQTAEQVAWLGRLIDTDVSTLDPQQPLPAELLSARRLAELPASETVSLGFRASVHGFLRENAGLPLAQLLVRSRFVGSGHSTFVGTPEQLADRLQDWYEAGAADGFVLAPDLTLETLQVLVDELVPVLQRKGIYKREYVTDTFAGHLNLPPFPGAGRLRFDTDPARRAEARATVLARRSDPRAEEPSAAAPQGVAAPLTVESLRGRRPVAAVALTGDALLEAVAEPDRLPCGPDLYVLGLDRALGPAPAAALDPTTAAAVLGLRRPDLAFLPVVAVEREHPWNLARTVASLGHWLRGRTGVALAVRDRLTAAGRAGAQAWDPGPFAAPTPSGVATTAEAAGVLRGLWDSYPNSALVVDRDRGIYATGEGIAPIDHVGAYRIAGPGAVGSPFHGRPLVAQVVGDPVDLLEVPEAVDLALVDGSRLTSLLDVLDRLPPRLAFLVVGGPISTGVADERILGSVQTIRSLSWE